MLKPARVHIQFVLLALSLLLVAAQGPAEARGRSQDPRIPILKTPTTDQVMKIPHSGQRPWLFSWQEVRGASAYHLEVHAAGIATPVLRKRIDTANYVHFVKQGYAKGALKRGWNWRVRALFRNRPGPWSAWGAFSINREAAPAPANPGGGIIPINPDQPMIPIDPQPDGTIKLATVPSLESPADGAALPNTDAQGMVRWRFAWSRILNAQTYHLEVRRLGAQRPAVSTFVRDIKFEHVFEGHVADSLRTGWLWRVRAYRNRRPLDNWSAYRSFTVKKQATTPRINPGVLPTIPVLSRPVAGARIANADANGQMAWTFSWIGVLPASSYRIQVRKKGASLFLVDATTTELTYTHRGEGYIAEANLQGWEWRVQALNAAGKPIGKATSWRTFDVAPR